MKRRLLLCLLISGAWVSSGPAVYAQTEFATRAVGVPAFNGSSTMLGYQGDLSGPHYEPAPMPDTDVFAPAPRVDDPKAASVAPHLFRPRDQFRGDGFAPGSTVQGSQEKQMRPAPGISMSVPLN